jgi:diguanylate cyclase (GGDEF)-like protein/PAS domain S-box-containing protein
MPRRKPDAARASTAERVRGTFDAFADAPDLHRRLLESLTDHAIFAVDAQGDILSWNAGARRLFGYTESQVIGRSFGMLFSADDYATGIPAFELAAAQIGGQTSFERIHVRKDGSSFPAEKTVRPLVDAAGAHMGFAQLVRTAPRTAAPARSERTERTERYYRAIFESIEDYAILTLSAEGTIVSWNAGARSLFGYEPAEIIGRNHAVLLGGADAERRIAQSELSVEAARPAAGDQRWLVRKDGSTFLASRKLRPFVGTNEPPGYVCVIADVVERDGSKSDLLRRAHFDELTALPNRRAFFEHVQRAISTNKRRSSASFAVLFIDLDHFKLVNDRYGHIAADSLLAETARRLERCVRSEDVVARIGGDEFAIFLAGISGITEVTDAAERIGIAMRAPVEIDGHSVVATVSIGIALASESYLRPEDILRDADAAMYVAKAEGRARSVVFESSMAIGGATSFDLLDDIRRGLDKDEFRMVYQPMVRLSNGDLTGFEALIRWQHPRLGLLQPGSFLPKAEESGLIVAIDRWTLREVARQIAAWDGLRSGGKPAKISVNVSSKNFSRPSFFDELCQIMRGQNADLARLRVEITESALLEQSDGVNALVAAIRAAGIEVDVDDFGTGYSSLSALNYLFVDALKIDVSFVRRMRSPNGAELVKTIVTLAHNLGIVAIAEGIETVEQLERLRDLGCDYGQGFHFSAALDADEAGRVFLGKQHLTR